MTSPTPLQPDTYYHIYNRGTNRENIFCEERNYTHFLKLYAHHIEPVAETFAYCLLRNHFHLLIKVKSEVEVEDPKGFQKPLGSGSPRSASHKFSDFFNAYAKAINQAYGRLAVCFNTPLDVYR